MLLQVGCSLSLQLTMLNTPCMASMSLVLGNSFRRLTPQRTRRNEHVLMSNIAGQPVLRASTRRSGLKLANSIRCSLNYGCMFSPFRLQSNASCPQTQRSWESLGSLDHSAMCLITSRCAQHVVFAAQQSHWRNAHSVAILNANLERPPAVWKPALLMHSCISF